jgi:hypothetical protein
LTAAKILAMAYIEKEEYLYNMMINNLSLLGSLESLEG